MDMCPNLGFLMLVADISNSVPIGVHEVITVRHSLRVIPLEKLLHLRDAGLLLQTNGRSHGDNSARQYRKQ